MINMMRADLYRIFRSKAIYITFVVMVVILFLQINAHQTGTNIGINFTMGEDFYLESVATGAVAAQVILQSMGDMIFILLPLILAVSMAVFSSGTIKNDLSMGTSRVRLYLSKWVLSAAVCATYIVLYISIAVIFATVSNGLGYWGNGLLANVLRIFGMQMLFVLAFSSVGVFLCFVTKKSAIVIASYIAFALLPPMIAALLHGIIPSVMEAYVNYDLWLQFTIFSQVADANIFRGLAVGLAYLIVPTVGGIMLFKKAEIK